MEIEFNDESFKDVPQSTISFMASGIPLPTLEDRVRALETKVRELTSVKPSFFDKVKNSKFVRAFNNAAHSFYYTLNPRQYEDDEWD